MTTHSLARANTHKHTHMLVTTGSKTQAFLVVEPFNVVLMLKTSYKFDKHQASKNEPHSHEQPFLGPSYDGFSNRCGCSQKQPLVPTSFINTKSVHSDSGNVKGTGDAENTDNADGVLETLSDITSNASSTMKEVPLVQQQGYRTDNLASNNVHIINRYNQLPPSQAILVDAICGDDCAFPDITATEIKEDIELEKLFGLVPESDVATMFLAKFCCWEQTDFTGKNYNQRLLMYKEHLPASLDASSEDRLSCPAPDLLFGYSPKIFTKFRPALHPFKIRNFSGNANDLILPFFSVQLKGQSLSSAGSLHVAENQVVGSSRSCRA